MGKIFKLFLLLVLAGFQVKAQAWLPGYNYRKKITINKALVSGNVNLEHFQLLVALEDPDLRYVAANCVENKLSGTRGRDFAFTLVSDPQTPLSYQLDEYVAASGKLLSWVRLPSLSAAGTSSPATQIYLYYGSNNIHFPQAAAAQLTWNNDQNRIWHMSAEMPGAPVVNAASSIAAEVLRPGRNITNSSYVPGKVGGAIYLNGSNQQLSSGKIISTNFFISFWIKFSATNREQVILSTDSAGFGGYVLKVDATGRLLQEIRTNSSTSSRSSTLVMVPERWYHVASQFYEGRRDIYIDGKSNVAGVGGVGLKQGGSLVVGSSKVQDKYFGGTIDELRIQTINPNSDFIMTSYVNQRDPAAFYVVSAEEANAVKVNTGMVFSNVVNDSWAEPGNWNAKEVPGNDEQVILAPGAKLEGGMPAGLSLNKLTLSTNAAMSVDQHVEVLCNTTLEAGARLSVRAGFFLQLDGALKNDGVLESVPDATSGGLRFSGPALQRIWGAGHIAVQELVLDRVGKSAITQLEQPVSVFNHVQPVMGMLNANGNLTLKHTGSVRQAFLGPIAVPTQASISGEVVVEQYVSGGFPSPATARGWRLWSSPVYHGTGLPLSYHLYDFKSALFITGPGGARNGFDDSPQNGHTIYIHNQSVSGSLSQKYSGVPAMHSTVDVGSGIYVFSRGDRQVPDAYVKQIQTAPFQSPGSYTIQHKGLLFQGRLQLELQNRNFGEAGDGFHLLGNPYAAVINWSELQKENLSPYVWKFNPLNNAYDVTDDPKTRISAGEGFFVKVLNGHPRGSLGFSESAKLSSSGTLLNRDAAVAPVVLGGTTVERPVLNKTLARSDSGRSEDLAHPVAGTTADSRIEIVLARDVFEQQYTLVLSPSGNDGVDDQDATALGTGYVSISGLAGSGGGIKLSVDTREKPGRRVLELPLYVKGYATGKYQLRISGLQTLEPGTEFILVDQYLHSRKVLADDQVYEFELNTDVAESFGEHRFVLMIKPVLLQATTEPARPASDFEVIIYPNPFRESFALKLPPVEPFRMEMRLRNLMGQMVLRRNFGLVNGAEVLEVDAAGLGSGTYLLELVNLDSRQPLKTSKIIKR